MVSQPDVLNVKYEISHSPSCFPHCLVLFCSVRSNYFYLGLPQNGLKLLGDWAHHLYDAAVFVTNSSMQYNVIRYWHLYHVHDSAMKSDVLVRKFIKHYVYYSIGRATSLVPLLRVGARIPVLTVYGTKVKFPQLYMHCSE